ncbi:MAG: helix-turn-helix domain-containing protein [Mycobacterium kyogaense]|uniref:helix-turn-helix domain-containing protein n=1 Tax=Mycobacterium kyogaense TaxID=2212479 RepID=UPI002FF9436B
MAIDISAVTRRSGVPASTLRFYEQKGLIASVGRRANRRLFDENVFDQLALIAMMRSTGFSLDEIARMLASGGTPHIDRAALASRASDIDATISKLTAISGWLKHAAACPSPDHMECPRFRHYLELASAAPTATRRVSGPL